jgi:hypothetical protein
VRRSLAVAVALLLTGPARAQPPAKPAPVGKPAPAPAKLKLVLAPVLALGGGSHADAARIERVLAGGFAGLDPIALVPAATLAEAIRAARRPELRACDGELGCLAELAGLVGADQIVHAELGGLGDAEVVFLELVDARARARVRTTTLELGAEAGRVDAAARAAVTRLVLPGRYVGTLAITTGRVDGATIYVDGERIRPDRPRLLAGPRAGAASGSGAWLRLAVGPHAVRVTHPNYRDFVRFVDVEFGKAGILVVDLVPYNVVDRELARTGGARPVAAPREQAVAAPWYRRWPVVAGGGALLFLTSALVVGAIVDGTDAEDHATIK